MATSVGMEEMLDFGDAAPLAAGPAVVAGVDPGKSGYIAGVTATTPPTLAFLDPIPTIPTEGEPHYDLPRLWLVVAGLRARGVSAVVMERQQVFPDQGAKSNFAIGYGYGLLEAYLTAAGLPYTTILPAVWKRRMDLLPAGGSFADEADDRKRRAKRRKAAKAKAVEVVQRMFPGIDLRDRRKEKARVPCPDIAEALLLALYGCQGVVRA
jgi:hypothetical protein